MAKLRNISEQLICLLGIIVFILSGRDCESMVETAGVNDNSSIVNSTKKTTGSHDVRLQTLEGHVTNILQELERLKEEKGNLSRRVSFLEMCDCQPKKCLEEGTSWSHGDTWSKGPCHVCRCHNGEVTCFVPNTPQCRQPKDCRCQHGGLCVEEREVRRCVCPFGCSGVRCQYLPTNPCVFLPETGNCSKLGFDETLTGSVQRYHYDWNLQTCKVFTYSGCGGSANNFPTRRKCEQACLKGACCIRRLYPGNKLYQPAKECKDIDLQTCRSFVKTYDSSHPLEVVRFSPGSTCEKAGFSDPGKCHDGIESYRQGEEFSQGCEDCRCEESGKIVCGCSRKAQRKELRDLTSLDRWRLQRAVAELRQPPGEGVPSTWEKLRDLYSQHIMHATHPKYFLLWHRTFLRLVERKLQETDCDISLPYYDVTMDAGAFHTAFLWQGNFFGGQGHGVDGECVEGHPFGNASSWKPCIMRRFNRSVQMPSILEIAQILNTDDFFEVSEGLKSVAAYVHTFVGGTMRTSNCVYDPVFLPVYAYVDHLFEKWLQSHPHHSLTASSATVHLSPFGVTSSLDDVCVEYLEATRGRECTEVDSDVMTWTDYDPDGYDSIGYDRDGFDRSGFNRDGFDKEGYDKDGYNRYGFDRQGYNIHGFDQAGKYKNGTTGDQNIFDLQGFDCFCRNRAGIDESGYDRFDYNLKGLDRRGCGFGYNGPFASKLMVDLWQWLSKQPSVVISSLGRYCPSLAPIDSGWWRQCWSKPSQSITGLSPGITGGVSNRLCIKMEPIYSTSCSCPSGYVTCAANPCIGAVCPFHPDATCFMQTCGTCTVMWIKNGRKIACEDTVTTAEHCQPNPCLNGGLCLPSRWFSRPADVICQCTRHFEGSRCERPATQVCLQNYQGSCLNYEMRWYFDLVSKTCRTFDVGECGGSSNNFPTRYHCERKCIMGACCYRTQRRPGLYGYDTQGYDRYGFNKLGESEDGRERDIDNGLLFGAYIHDQWGFDFRGYDESGYNEHGFDKFGYDYNGYDHNGFNRTGYNKIGDYDGDISFNREGFNKEGYNRAGIDCHGSEPTGLDKSGLISGHDYACAYTSREECYSKTSDSKISSHVSFKPVVNCDQAWCHQMCKCYYGLNTYEQNDIIKIGCGIVGICNGYKKIDHTCKALRLRKEIRDLNSTQWQRLHFAIKTLSTGYPSQWNQFTSMYAAHSHLFQEGALFLPWMRYYLHQVESALQEIDCGITIPYFDWTVDSGDMATSMAWQANAFGGDGGEPEGCVKRHPFQDPYQKGWEPCLRRNFSTLSPLPHTVHVHRILREPDFLSFSNQLKHLSDIFRQWVGGHMTTDHAAYDPLFLAHAAYLDKLWTDWHRRHPAGVFSFPPGERFAPMPAFQISPEDIFYSEVLCVKYVKLTEGVLCRLPEVPVELGPKVPEYDSEGYDAFGYDRHGFDSRGFDRNGYKSDTFNRDGYDAHGFNRYGYDRFGFDIHGYTRLGFHRNGTHKNEVNEVDIAPIYDISGYDRYGFNKYGLDREGRDIYGLDSEGLDSDGCDFHTNGPFYVIHKARLDETLENLDMPLIEALPVSCPNIDGLFTFPLLPDFLHGETNGDILRQEQALALRFCVILSTRNACGIGQYETPCSTDLCRNEICLEKDGVGCWTQGCNGVCLPYWYNLTSGAPVPCSACRDDDGKIYENGRTWNRDPCTECLCDSGNVQCSSVDCPNLPCSQPVRLPDKCCASCDDCLLGKVVYADGAEVPTTDESCQRCRCRHGNIVCEPVECVPVPRDCKNVTTPPGGCCAQCGDCDSTDTDTWRDDQCRLCNCQNGVITCEEAPCSTAKCSHAAPPRPPEQCCPTCHDCLHEGSLVRHGHEIRPDPCFTCRCDYGNVTCVIEACEPLTCRNPIHVPGQCCPQCTTDCEYEGKMHRDGDVFHPHYNPCLECTCVTSMVRCSPIQCPPVQLPCQHPLPMSGECCPAKCPECDYKGSLYEHGEEWADGPCEKCECSDGVVNCQPTQSCPPPGCSHGAPPRGECCPVCTDCMYEGERRQDGSVFTVGFDEDCRECACVQGHVMCHNIGRCPPVACYDPVKEPGRCCAMCRGCIFNGESFEDGAIMPSRQSCQKCRCANGKSVCSPVSCPKLTCDNPVPSPGECCPRCPETCFRDGREYHQGQRVPHHDRCTSCVCDFGSVRCRRQSCPPVNCENPRTSPGECCPLCDSTPACQYGGRAYKEGETLLIPGRECQECRCRNRRIDCQYKPCPEARCLYPVQDGCCPSCNGCSFNGLTYRNNERFPDPRGQPCAECTCNHGNVTCDHVRCQDISCSHPVTKDGDCCPKCSDCFYDGQIRRSGKSFTERTEPCVSCRCHFGSVTCERQQCPPLRCQTHKPALPGQCCPTCDDEAVCEYNGQSYSEGREIPLNRDECEVCICKGGRIHCARVECPMIQCQHPRRGKCCQECEGCLWYDQEYTNGQVFTHARAAPCKECTCYYGTIECSPKPCPGMRCSHPVDDPDPNSCCPICSDCQYEGVRHRDGSSFPSRLDPCQTCQCRVGSVTCHPKQCPPSRCPNPRRRPGECCPVCDRDSDSCSYGSRVYSDGETIQVNRDKCEKCVCEKGRIACGFVDCPKVQCQHPVKEGCCPSCRGCFWNGVTYQHGQSLPDPRDSRCYQCVCSHGTVTCDHVECPPAICDSPVTQPGDCCPTCAADCTYENQFLRNGEVVTSRTDPCRRCQCQSGHVICKKQDCPAISCDNPVLPAGACCPVCDPSGRCEYSGRVLEEGQLVPRLEGDCEVCRCRNGRITCSRERCQPLTCTNPIPGSCCPSCQGCMVNGREYHDQERLGETEGRPCQECICNRGNITCRQKPCPDLGCSHPATSPGSCCPTCTDCLYEGQLIASGDAFIPETDPCSECLCDSGRVTCRRKECPKTSCTNPVPPGPGECCPHCAADCFIAGKSLQHGDFWIDPSDPCSECVCDGGTLSCSTTDCPPVTCPHPIQGQCCLECGPCQLRGLKLLDGDIRLDPNDPCIRCECKAGDVICGQAPCPEVDCAHPIPGECGCLSCPKHCVIHSVRVEDGELVANPDNPCETCTCRAGELVCEKIFCVQLNCARTFTQTGQCCSACSDCDVGGLIYHDGDTFPHFLDPCQSCRCEAGDVFCEPRPCDPVQCSHPGTDGCCLTCDGCSVNGALLDNNAQFNPEPCQTCLCQNGDLICQGVTCPNLTCPTMIHDENECCPICKGCEMFGSIYDVGSTWRPQGDQCTLCQCFQAMTICSSVECLTPCLDPITLEGHCCPVCPGGANSGCEFNSKQYDEGEIFSPTGNPCDICECLNGSLNCYMKKCDLRYVCPEEEYMEPLPGQCCGSCRQVNTHCTKADIGRLIQPTDDPCFMCECAGENILECGIYPCLPLDCPEDEQVTLPDACCPKCAACQVPSTSERLVNGGIWQSPLDPCFYCHCNLGQISCEHMTCQAMECPEGEVLSKHPEKCCPQCVEEEHVMCNYGNITYQLGEGWRVDECTSCFCDYNSQVSCRTERCPPLQCSANEDPSLVPGQCCPICITKPAICTVFGDPHYQTFDGGLVSFQGTCRYVMSADCKSGTFTVETTHNDRGTNGVVSWVDTITLNMNNTSIDILRGHKVKVNGTEVTLPYLDSSIFYIELRGDRVLLFTNIGLQILWDGDSYAELSVPGVFQGALCGLCGNFNGFSQDDFTTRTGLVVTSSATFGNSWAVVTNETCPDASDIDTCAQSGYRIRKLANTKCAPIKGPLFSECHRVVPPDVYFASCVYDLCACDDVEKCQCDAFSAYAQACTKAGVTINWRSQGLCAIGCLAELGFMFDECGPACPTTCENIHIKRSGMTSQCLRPCVPGCQCPAHLVLHQGRCIDEGACPSIVHKDGLV